MTAVDNTVAEQLKSLISMIRLMLNDPEQKSRICSGHEIGLESVIERAEAALKAAQTNDE